MSVADIISQIDAQILRLQQARSILVDAPAPAKRHGGRRPTQKATPVKRAVLISSPAKPVEPAREVAPAPVTIVKSKRRALSPEGRKRIQEAQRQRWAERRKDGVSPEPVKVVPPTPSALSGAVPAGPVAVSAEEVRKAEARRAQLEAAHHAETLASDWLVPKPAPELTIDMLFKDLSDSPKTTEETTNVN
jgi:hypothetical protein